MVLATVVPYLVARWSAPPGTTYSWILPPYPEDSLAYHAWCRQAVDGHLLFTLKYTALPQARVLFMPFFLLSGWLSRASGLAVGPLLLVVKTIGVWLFWWVFFRFVEHLKLDRLQAATASVIVGIGSGFGGLAAALLGRVQLRALDPPDLWLVDLNTLWSLVWNPLFPFSLALMLLAFLYFDRASEGGEPAAAWGAGACLSVLALIHPYPVVLLAVFFLVAGYARLKLRVAPVLLRVCAAAAPGCLYAYAAEWLNPLLRGHEATGTMSSPSPLSLAVGLGLPVVLFCLSPFTGRPSVARKLWPLVLWVGLAVALSWAPLWFQRKMLFGLGIPMGIVAAVVLERLAAKILPAGRRIGGTIALLIVTLPVMLSSYLVLVPALAVELRRNDRHSFFIPDNLRSALDYLARYSDPDEVVLASIPTSLLVPAISGNTVVWGHWAQSVDLAARREWYRQVFLPQSGLTGGQRRAQFLEAGIDWLVAEPVAEGGIDLTPPPWLAGVATRVFEAGPVAVYRIRSGN
jgi:hypothetical protein